MRLNVLRKRTAISLRFKNEAFNISERYYSQSLFLFLNSVLSEQHVVWILISLRRERTNHSPFLVAFRKLAANFATLGCFEEVYGDFATL